MAGVNILVDRFFFPVIDASGVIVLKVIVHKFTAPVPLLDAA
jgi:hypothetical protein